MFDWFAEQLKSLFLWGLGVALIGLGIWAYPTIKQQLATVQTGTENTPIAPSITPTQTAALIVAAEANVRDPRGWGNDLLEALKLHDLPQSKENVCAIIAITDQESGFITNPSVPNLGKLAEKAVIEKLNKVPMLGSQAGVFLNHFPSKDDSFMQRIRNAKTERDLDLAYRDLIDGITQYARQYKLDILLDNGFARDFIESYNEINTIGSMQVAVSFATQYETEKLRKKALSLQEVYQIRDKLYTRKGGLYYGTLLLLGYESGYDKKIYRFADFNAGRYSSRNAAFQATMNTLLDKPIATDGDLLIYKANGNIAAVVSGTEQAVRSIAQKYAIKRLTDTQIHRDLMQEKTLAFNQTMTYKAVLATYTQATGKKPVLSQIPQIELQSEKTSRILTTEKFATTVNGRYQKCIAQTFAE